MVELKYNYKKCHMPPDPRPSLCTTAEDTKGNLLVHFQIQLLPHRQMLRLIPLVIYSLLGLL